MKRTKNEEIVYNICNDILNETSEFNLKVINILKKINKLNLELNKMGLKIEGKLSPYSCEKSNP